MNASDLTRLRAYLLISLNMHIDGGSYRGLI